VESDRTLRDRGLEHSDLIESLVRTSFVTTAVLSRIAAEHELSLTQLRVMAILRDRHVAMNELAVYLGLDRSTISGLVDRGERRGLLQRTRNPCDGRGVDVSLTREGRRLAERGAHEVARELRPMTSALSSVETVRLAALLDRMLDTTRCSMHPM